MGTEGVVVMDKYQRIQGASLVINMKNIPVFKGVNTVGRNKTAIIDIKHLSVSQNQAVLVIVDDQQHFVTDLGSSNGTFLHGTQLVPFKLYELTHEAILKFGTIVAKYIKHTKNNVTINLDSESMDFTQNITQTVYAADTQLYTNQTISGSNITSQNIHSLETQPVDYPLNNKVSGSGEKDIHTMETQHADYMFQAPSAPSGKQENIKEKEAIDGGGPVKEDMPNYSQEECNLANEAATQVDDYSLKPMKDHDQYLKKLNDREDAVTPPAGSGENFIGECFEDPFYHNNTNMDFSLPEETSDTNNHDAPTQVDNEPLPKVVEEASEKTEGDSEATQIVNTINNKELLSRPSAGDAFEEDSFAIHSKCSSNVIVDDSMADSHLRAENCNESGNESDDLLTMPLIVDCIDPVSAPSHEIQSEAKKAEWNLVGKSLNRVKSDSETDIDSTEEIVRRKRRCRKLDSESLSNLSSIQAAPSPKEIESVNTHSDSETDIEDECGKPDSESAENKTDNNDSVLSETQKIKPITKSKKALFESDSDNEKDIMCSNKNEETDSETDIDEESGKAPVAENDKDISLQVKLLPECDANIPETSLNDTDCIPATQDAFATVFSYKRNDQNHSSEESFKLGLTELMVEDDCNTVYQIDSLEKVSQPESTVKSKKVLNSSKSDESTGNKEMMNPEEKCMGDKPQEITAVTDCKEQTERLGQKVAKDNLAGTANKDEICEDDYLMPTQKIETQSNINTSENKNSDQTCDVDYYSMPTQELETKSPFRVPTKKYTFKNKKVLLDNTMSTLLNVVKEDDMYIAPTQMIGSESEDVYMQATQTITSQKITGHKTKSYDDDHLYCQATQEIMLVKSTDNTQTDDMYLMATQPIQQLKDQEQAGPLGVRVGEDVYDIPTQVINNEPTSNSQAEMQIYDKNQPSCDESNRPENPLAQVLQVDSKKDPKRSNTDSAGSPRHKKVRRTDIESLKRRIEEDDSETLSQIQAFVQKPIDEITQQENEIKKKSLSLRKTKRRVSEDVETLSQIEAFINKPVESKPIIQVKDDTEKLAAPKKRSRRVIKDRSDLDISEDPNGDADISKDVYSDKEETLPNLSKEQEVKSEVDQSFAILASKVNKTRKRAKKTDKLCKIKVAEVKRSSMDIAEASRIKDYEISLPRKSRRFTTNNLITQPIEKAKASSHKKKIPESNEIGVLDFENMPINTVINQTNCDDTIGNSKSSRRIRKTTASGAVNNIKEIRLNRNIKAQSKEVESLQKDGKNEVYKLDIRPELRSELYKESDTQVKNTRKTNEKVVDKDSVSRIAGADRSEKNSSSEDNDMLTSPGRSKDTPKRKQRPKVVFTMLDNPQLESHIRQLGGSVVDSVDMATVLVTNCVKRSQKLLTSVGQGKPVCSPEWIISSKKKHAFLEPWDFILIDKEAEKRWNFSLKESLEKASKKPLLEDYTFHIMVNKAADVLKSAIEACGGKCVSRIKKNLSGGNYVIIATPDQKSKYTKITKQNPDIKIVVEPEAIFDGVLRQELRLSQHALV